MIDELKEKIKESESRKEELLLEIKENYDLDDEYYPKSEDIENGILYGDILPDWFDKRDYEYADSNVCLQKELLSSLEHLQ